MALGILALLETMLLFAAMMEAGRSMTVLLRFHQNGCAASDGSLDWLCAGGKRKTSLSLRHEL
jgi:hypothetical protein